MWSCKTGLREEKQIENYVYAFFASRVDLSQCSRKRGPKPLKKARGVAILHSSQKNLDFSCLRNKIRMRSWVPWECDLVSLLSVNHFSCDQVRSLHWFKNLWYFFQFLLACSAFCLLFIGLLAPSSFAFCYVSPTRLSGSYTKDLPKILKYWSTPCNLCTHTYVV